MTPASAAREIGPAQDPRPPRTVDFGLVIGVDHYPRFRSLNGAIADARRFHEWLCDPDGGGVTPANARLIVSRADPVAPVQDEIDEQLLDLVTAADAIGGGRRLYFHFSGHGASSALEPSEDVALLLARWSLRLAGLALSSDLYRHTLFGMGLFEELVVTLDCCRTAAERIAGVRPTLTVVPRTHCCETRTFVAYATAPGASAWEVRDENTWQGVFTRELLAILRTAPHGLSAADLKRELEYAIRSAGQRAHVKDGLHATSRFGRRGAMPRVVIEFEHARGRVLLRNGAYAVIDEHDTEDGAWELELPRGLYELECGTASKPFSLGGEAVKRVLF